MEHLSFELLALVLIIVVGLIVIVRGFTMPRNFQANQRQREELRKKFIEENPLPAGKNDDSPEEDDAQV